MVPSNNTKIHSDKTADKCLVEQAGVAFFGLHLSRGTAKAGFCWDMEPSLGGSRFWCFEAARVALVGAVRWCTCWSFGYLPDWSWGWTRHREGLFYWTSAWCHSDVCLGQRQSRRFKSTTQRILSKGFCKIKLSEKNRVTFKNLPLTFLDEFSHPVYGWFRQHLPDVVAILVPCVVRLTWRKLLSIATVWPHSILVKPPNFEPLLKMIVTKYIRRALVTGEAALTCWLWFTIG